MANPSPKGPVLGKPEVVRFLMQEGFTREVASRAYDVLLLALEEGLRAGRVLYFKRIFKIWPDKMPPRKRWDNWHKRHVFFGEQIVLKIKPLFVLKEEEREQARAGHKIKAGRRRPERKTSAGTRKNV